MVKNKRRIVTVLSLFILFGVLAIALLFYLRTSDRVVLMSFQEAVRQQGWDRLYDLFDPSWRERFDPEKSARLLTEIFKVFPSQFNVIGIDKEYVGVDEVARFYRVVPTNPSLKPFVIPLEKKKGIFSKWYIDAENLFDSFFRVQYGFMQGGKIWQELLLTAKRR